MIVTTQNVKNNKIKEYTLDENSIRLTNRGGVGVSIKNLLKLGKNENIINIEMESVDYE